MKKNKSLLSRILYITGVLVCIILLPILIMNITIVVKSYISPNEVPDFFGIKPFIVVTGSMEDTINSGDLVITKAVDPATLEVGDIISYREGESVITHRIVEFTEEEGEAAFITQGDANNAEDSNPVLYSQVEGTYLFRLSGLGNLAMYMQTPVGMLVFIGIPICCFILYDVIRRRLDNKKDSGTQAEIDRLKAQLAEMENGADTPEGDEDITE